MRGPRHCRAALLAAAMAAALLTGACTADAPAGGDSSIVESPPPVHDIMQRPAVADLSLPLDSYHRTGRDGSIFARALDQLVNDCLARFGFPPLPPSPAMELSAAQAQEIAPVGLARRYGVTDPAIAAETGYRPSLAEGFGEPSLPAPPERYLTAVEMLILDGQVGGVTPAGDPLPDPHPDAVPPPGVTLPSPDPDGGSIGGVPIPDGGCHGEARRALGEDEIAHDDAALPGDLATRAWFQAEADQRVVDVFAAWSDCMRSRGHSYEHPLDPGNEFSAAVPTPSPEEIQTALDDIACKDEHNVVGVWHSVELAYQEKLIEQNAERLDDLRTKYEDTVRRAADLLGMPAP